MTLRPCSPPRFGSKRPAAVPKLQYSRRGCLRDPEPVTTTERNRDWSPPRKNKKRDNSRHRA